MVFKEMVKLVFEIARLVIIVVGLTLMIRKVFYA